MISNEMPLEERAKTEDGQDMPALDQPLAWEQIENGRYRPRRIRGSCLGLELG